MKNTSRAGFTIVELVIVIAVIAVLAAVGESCRSDCPNNTRQSSKNIEHRNCDAALHHNCGVCVYISHLWVTERERDAASAAQGGGRIHSVREQNEVTRLEL